jgi:hypothetical protein
MTTMIDISENLSTENFTTNTLDKFIAAFDDIERATALVDGTIPVLTQRYCDLVALHDAMHYAEATAHHRELAGISAILELSVERAMQRVRTSLLENATGKAPTVALMESTASTDQIVQKWRILQIRITTLKDQFAGLTKALEMAIQAQRS